MKLPGHFWDTFLRIFFDYFKITFGCFEMGRQLLQYIRWNILIYGSILDVLAFLGRSKRWFRVVKKICKKMPQTIFELPHQWLPHQWWVITCLYAALLPYSCTADWKIIASQYKYTHYQIISWMNNENLQKIRLSPHFLNIFVIHPEILW